MGIGAAAKRGTLLALDDATNGLETLASRLARGKLVVAIDGYPRLSA